MKTNEIAEAFLILISSTAFGIWQESMWAGAFFFFSVFLCDSMFSGYINSLIRGYVR